MEYNSQSEPEQLVKMWESILPHCPISVEDLCNPKPCFFIGALSEFFQLMGINKDSVLSAKVDGVEDNHSEYYADFTPAINVTRALNHILESFHGNTCLFDVVYPRSIRVMSHLKLLINIGLFMGVRQEAINGRIEKLYESKDEIDRLNKEKNLLLIEVNETVAAKASRSGRMRKVNDEIEVLLAKLKEETALRNEQLAVVQALEKKNDEEEAKLDLVKKENDILAEHIAKKQAQILPNAVDLKIKRDQVIAEEKELSEVLESKKSVLWVKKNTASNLDTVNEIFQEAINLLDSFMSVQESLKSADALDEEVEMKIKSMKEDLVVLSNQTKKIQDENVRLEKQCQCRLQETMTMLQEVKNDTKQVEAQHAKTSNLKASMEEYRQRMRNKRMLYESKKQTLMEELNQFNKLRSEILAEIEDTLTRAVQKGSTHMITQLRNLFDGSK